MSNPLSDVLTEISPFDSEDLAATAGGLQLLPENAERIVRLEALAHASASIASPRSSKKISAPRLRNLLNNVLYRMFGAAEDPPPDCIVEEIPFFGGSYRVFPGTGESFPFIIRNLIGAIFLSPHISDKHFLQAAYDAAAGLLAVSNEVAHRAQLRRGTEPIAQGRDVKVPSADVLERLKRSVTFSESDLKELLQRHEVVIEGIVPFVADAGLDHASSYTVEIGPLHAQPIIRFGTTYVVACPGALLDALAHRLNCLAIDSKLQTEYAVAYNHVVRASAAESFRFLRHEALAPAPTKLTFPPTVGESVAGMDSDKVTHALVVTDSLEGYDVTGKTRNWDMGPLSDFLVNRMKEIEQHIHADDPNRRILFLLVHQATGRAYGMRIGEFSEKSLFHMVSAADLRTISLVDSDDPLAIWNFVESRDKLRERRVQVHVWNTLDEYGFYRQHEYSFYVGDDRLPDLISIHPADFARPLRCKIARRLDVQAVPHFKVKGTIEVRSLHGNPRIPIYVPVGPRRGRVAVFVDGLPRPVWIVGPEKTDNDAIYGELADAIAYWLWQASEGLRGLMTGDSVLTIEISIAEETAREGDNTSESLPGVLVERPDSSNLRIVFTSTFRKWVREADNRADRELLKSLLLALTARNADAKSEHERNEVVERVAPLGLKKKVLSFNPGADPALDGRGLPPYRGVRKYQIGKLLDSVGEHLANSKLLIGSIADGQRTAVLNGIVGFCYGRLQELVASMAEDDTLEFVVRQHEAMLHRQAVGKATITTRLACFGNDPEIVASFRRALQDEARDAISIRFLIEYIAAAPPHGLLPMTLERFDEMLMLASEITNFGMLSDTVRNDLADLKLSVVPSGRLGISGDQYKRVSNEYMEAFAGHELYVAPSVFRRLTMVPEEDAEPPELVKHLDVAAVAEFGYSIADLSSLVGELLKLGDAAHPFCSAKRDELHKSVHDATGWTEGQVKRIIDSLLLRPRADFLKPEPSFPAAEVYPWRFNRNLSYLRRPLIERNGGEEIVWGYRHVFHAHENLLKLCLSGRLRAISTEMKNFISSVTNRQGAHFNDQVAQLFAYPGLKVRKRVSKVPGATGLNNVGDLDVLVADPRRRRLEVIECKDLSNARTPHERKLEIENLLGSERVENPIVVRHQKRLKWVKENLQSVLTWLGLGPAKGWKVDAYIVVDYPLMAPFLRETPMRIVPFGEFESELLAKYGKPMPDASVTN